MITQLDPPIYLASPKGSCLAHFLIDYGIEHHLYWVTFQCETGECWTWNNKDIRIQKNITLGRTLNARNDSISTDPSFSCPTLPNVSDRGPVPLYPFPPFAPTGWSNPSGNEPNP